MPLDAVCLQAVVAELSPLVAGSRIEKIQQPARDQVVLLLRGSRRLGYSQPYSRGNLSVLVIYAVHQFFRAQRVHVAKAVVALFGYVCHGVFPFRLVGLFTVACRSVLSAYTVACRFVKHFFAIFFIELQTVRENRETGRFTFVCRVPLYG